MRRFALYLSFLLIAVLGFVPFYVATEALSLAKPIAQDNRVHWQTANTKRIGGENIDEFKSNVIKAKFPTATSQSGIERVIVVSDADWSVALASLALAAPPKVSAYLLVDNQRPLEDLERLDSIMWAKSNETENFVAPIENDRLPQLILIGDLPQEIITYSNSFSTTWLQGSTTSEVLAAVDKFVSNEKGVNNNVIFAAKDKVELALPASTWVAHTGTPFYIYEENKLDAAVIDALRLREGKANFYVLDGQELPETIARELSGLGTITITGNADIYQNAVDFARLFDEETLFGWRASTSTAEGGRHYLLVNPLDWKKAVMGSQLFSGSVFGPLLLTSQEKPPAIVEKYLWENRPEWWVTPAEGPYTMTWVLGENDDVDYSVQARTDFATEIQNYEDQGPQGLSGLEALFLVLMFWNMASAAFMYFHMTTHLTQINPFMKIAWVLLGLVLGLAAVIAYYLAYRGYYHQTAMGEWRRPLWVQVMVATLMTLAFGSALMVVGSFFLALRGFPLNIFRGPLYILGTPMLQNVLWAYFVAIVGNAFIFVPMMVRMNEDSSYWDSVRDNLLPVFVSMTAITIGMMSTMWWLQMEYLVTMPEEENLLWWGTMYIGIYVGFLTGYAANWPLVTAKLKKGVS